MLVRVLFSVALVLLIITGNSFGADEQAESVTVKKIVIESPSNLKTGGIKDTARQTRILFLTKEGCDRCEQELARLRSPGGEFEKLQAAGWKIGNGPSNHIQILESESQPDLVKRLKVREYPAVACVVDDEIIRSFKDGCTTPLDVWTFGWLLKGVNERPQGSISEAARVETTGNYRLRGNHWTIEGDPNPSKQAVLNHLRGPNHVNSVSSYGAIENWSTEELRSLHDDIHEREGGNVAAATYFGPSQPPAANRSLDAFSGSRKVMGR